MKKRTLLGLTIACFCILGMFLINHFAIEKEVDEGPNITSRITFKETTKNEMKNFLAQTESPYTETDYMNLAKVDLSTISSLDMGAEGPRIVYADKEIVVFESFDLFVFDLKKKKLINSYNIRDLYKENSYKNCATQCYGMKDGKSVLLGIFADPSNLLTLYRISLVDGSCKKIHKDELSNLISDNKVYTCEEPDRENPLFSDVVDYISIIDEQEYVYLISDMTVAGIQLVHINNYKKNVYDVFSD